MSTERTPRVYEAVDALAGLQALDPPADFISTKVRELVPAGPVKDALSGTWLGHALHPLLTDLPIGSWTSALLLDWLGGKKSEAASERLIGIGLAAAAPTFATGWLEYSDTAAVDEGVKRLGIVHALSNGGGALLFAGSLAARRRGARGRGKLLALAGGALLGVGGWLGGHLSYSEGVGVDQTTFEHPGAEWRDVLAADAVAEGSAQGVQVDGVAVMVARSGGELFALSDRCTHRGGRLHEGKIADGCVTCPLHGSVFSLRDGSVKSGPTAYPEPVWSVRERDGRLEVRPA